MNLKSKIKKFSPLIKRILRSASKTGELINAKVYLVGGGVRDIILGKRSFDIDLAIEGSGIKFCRALWQEVGGEVIEHSDFDTATLKTLGLKIDISACRKEKYAFSGALPQVEPATLSEDLKRRDFTINALALSLNRPDWGEVIDLYGGIKDIKAKKINVLHKESFLDDPTRILRAVRFKVRLGFGYSPLVLRLFGQAHHKKALKLVNLQRIRDELILMLKENNPYAQIKELNRVYGLDFIASGFKLEKKDFFLLLRIKRAILSLRRLYAGREIDTWLIYLMGLFWPLKPHAFALVLEKMRFCRGEEKRLWEARSQKTARRLYRKLSPFKLYKLLKPLSFEVITFMYAQNKNRILRRNIIDFLKKYNKISLKIKGRDLLQMGIKPSWIYGRIFDYVLRKKLENRAKTLADELFWAKVASQKLRTK